MSNSIREKCKALRLAHVADMYEKVPFETPEQFLSTLLQRELDLREAAKGERLIKKAKFMNEKELENYQWSDHIRFLRSLTEAHSNRSILSTGKRILFLLVHQVKGK